MSQDYAKGFYNNKAWKHTQAAYMASQHYICERCGNVARIVHHITRITPQNINNPAVTLDWDNLESLCIDCHNAEHMGSNAIAEGFRFTGDGDIVPL